MEETEALEALKQLKGILDENGIEFWLESGTLLGAIREGGFIKWDYDIDIGTWDINLPKMKKLNRAFCELGYETYYSVYHNVMMIRKGEIDIQLVFWRLDGDRAIAPLRYIENKIGFILASLSWMLLFSRSGKLNEETLNSFSKIIKYCGSKISDLFPQCFKLGMASFLNNLAVKTKNRRGLVVTPSKYFLNLEKKKFYDMDFLFPVEAEQYLAYYYGEDWRTPKKDWNYVREDKKLISKTEHIGEKWEYRKFKNKLEK